MILELFFKTTCRTAHADDRANAQNLLLEERLPQQREDAYAVFLTPPASISAWRSEHLNYVATHVNRLNVLPETFEQANAPNCFPKIDEDQYVIRVENLNALISIAGSGDSAIELADMLRRVLADPTDAMAKDIVADFLEACNTYRDRRPLFAGFWGEVSDLLEPETDHWPDTLRDRFGLGHLDPLSNAGAPIPVLVLRYRVSEVMAAAAPADTRLFAVPTVLDGDLSPFFCPTPKGWAQGQTVNLTASTLDDYQFTYEILHRYIAYQPEHVYKVGEITTAPGMTCEEARQIHFAYLQNDFVNWIDC